MKLWVKSWILTFAVILAGAALALVPLALGAAVLVAGLIGG